MPASRAMLQRKRGVEYTAGEIVELVGEMYRKKGEPVTYHRFAKWSGIPAWQIYLHFRSWYDVRMAAGLPRAAPNMRNIPVEQLLEELHEAVQELQHWPTVMEYEEKCRRSYQLLSRKIGPWLAVQARYREWLQAREPPASPSTIKDWWNPQRAAESRTQIPWMRDLWFQARVGFELKASDFRSRPADCCDLLVVLDADWPQCPVPVIEFSTIFGKSRRGLG